MENVEIIIEIPYKKDENLFQQIMNSIINLKDKSSDYVVVLNSKTVEDNVFMPATWLTRFSIGLVIKVSISSGEAPS